MKRAQTLISGAALALSLIAVSSASAVTPWDPQGTNFPMTQEGHSTFTGSAGGNLTCSGASTTLNATGAVASTITVNNPISFVGCTASVAGAAVTVTTFGTWTFTATTTTNVNIAATSATGKVATIHVPSLGCDVTVNSAIAINNNTWDNTAHTLSVNGAVSVPIVTSGLCSAAFGTSMKLDANFVAPDAIIT